MSDSAYCLGDVSAVQLLAAWEHSYSLGLPGKALGLVRCGYPGIEPARLARLALGRRNRLLLDLRGAWFGRRMAAQDACAACGEQVTMEFATDAIAAELPPDEPASWDRSIEEWTVRFRLPTSLDLEYAANAGANAGSLLRRCVIDVTRGGANEDVAALPPTAIDAVSQAMQELDPLADIRLDAECPNCGHRWRAPLDVARFVWAEVDVWARRMLAEVRLLASRFGWTEGEILRLGPMRRQFYLQACRP